jgi:hypothetical protein
MLAQPATPITPTTTSVAILTMLCIALSFRFQLDFRQIRLRG